MSRDSESIPSLWEKVAHNLQEMYTEAVGWTGEKARIGVKRMDILGIQRQLRRLLGELGGRVYERMQSGASVEDDGEVRRLLDAIRRLETDLEQQERELHRMKGSRSRGETGPAEAPGSGAASRAEKDPPGET